MQRLRTIALCIASVVTGATVAPVSFAAPEHLATIESECQTQLGYSASRCACFRTTAETDLCDNGQAFVAAQVTKDQAGIASTQSMLTGDEMMAAIGFLTTAPQKCP